MAKTKGRQGKSGRKARGLTKSQKSLVTSMIDHKLDQRVEDKYIRDALYISTEANWDATYHMVATDITPTIVEGDTVSTRTGLRISPKFMRVDLRYVPQGYDSALVNSESPNPVIVSQVPSKTPMEAFVIRMPRKVYESTSLNDIMGAINTRYRPPGLWKQDTLEATAQNLVKSFHLLDKTVLSSRYNSQMVRLADSLNPTHSQCRMINSPLMSFGQLQFKFLNKFLLYENVSDKDANYSYLLITRVVDIRVDTTFTPSAAPLKLERRSVFVYEDA